MAFLGREDETLATPAPADVDTDSGRDHSLQVFAKARLVEPAVDIERRDADGEDTGRARVRDDGSQAARKLTGL